MSEFPAFIDLSTLDGTDGFRLDGIDADDRSGRSVASAGDVNGDGFDDLLISAFGGDSSAGESYVVFGKAGGFAAAIDLASLDGTDGFRLDGIDPSDRSGRSVASAGDVNGDGFDDILIGADGADPGGDVDAGESYVVFGKAGGFAASLDLGLLDGTNGFRLDGIATGDYSGYSVASAGDVNGDGFDDILIGALGGDPGGDVDAGESYVVFGKAGGFAANLDLSTLDGTNGFRLDGIDAGDRIGLAVASAGDVNGDGFDDILIAASFGDPGGDVDAGESYVVFGKAGGFTASLDLGLLDGTDGFRLDGLDANDRSGRAVASAGDVNGDGFDDILIGAFAGDPGGLSYAGESYVVFGKAGGFTASLDLGLLDGTDGFRLDGIDAGDRIGRAVASAGDVNGDGFDDILVGAYGGDPGGDGYAGESYVVFGKAGGFAGSLDLSTLDGANGFRLDGIDAFDFSGLSVAGAGDVDGDGFDDILIGAYGGDPGGDGYAGESYVIFGRAPDAAVTRIGAAGDQYINGGAFDDTLSGLGGNDRLEGRGGADDLIGGDGNDIASYEHAGAGVTVDLATPANNLGDAAGDTYATIEQFHLSGFGDIFIGDGANNLAFGLGGDDALDGGGGNDNLAGGAGADSLNGGGGGGGSAAISGGAGGIDTASYISAEAGVVANLATPAVNTGDALGDTYTEIENLAGSQFADTLTGDGNANRLTGNKGDDALDGGGGNDVLVGGAGGDTMAGGLDNDTYHVDSSLDTATENDGEGTDQVLASVSFELGDFVDNLTLTGTALIDGTGNGQNNRLIGNSAANMLTGAAGNDHLNGNGGGDTLAGGVGNDTYQVVSVLDTVSESDGEGTDTVKVNFTYTLGDFVENLSLGGPDNIAGTGNGLANRLTGNNADNLLSGADGDDTLVGGSGADTLAGGLGRDTMSGGVVTDIFDFNAIGESGTTRGTADIVRDFVQGEDTIDLNDIDASATGGGNEDFVLLANDGDPFTAEGQARWYQLNSSTYIELNTAGTTGSELTIRLLGLFALTAADFVL